MKKNYGFIAQVKAKQKILKVFLKYFKPKMLRKSGK